MRRGLARTIDKADQCRVCTQVNDIAKDGQIRVVVLIYRPDQANRFKAADGIDKIAAVKSVPTFDLFYRLMLHQACFTSRRLKG